MTWRFAARPWARTLHRPGPTGAWLHNANPNQEFYMTLIRSIFLGLALLLPASFANAADPAAPAAPAGAPAEGDAAKKEKKAKKGAKTEKAPVEGEKPAAEKAK